MHRSPMRHRCDTTFRITPVTHQPALRPSGSPLANWNQELHCSIRGPPSLPKHWFPCHFLAPNLIGVESSGKPPFCVERLQAARPPRSEA